MPKIRKLKRRKTFKVNINRKRLRNKLRKLPDIGCKDIKDAWEHTKSTRHNLDDMGLAYDANETLKIPNFKKEVLSKTKLNTTDDLSKFKEENGVGKMRPKSHIAMNLEAEAKAPRERCFRLPNQQVQFVTYMMDRYGDDYESMARDKKNYYQMTWRQIRAKINSFKNVPEQYAEYLLKKGEIVLDNEETLEETRKRVAAENVAKHCAPKPKKKVKQTSQWLEESLDEFDTEDKLEDITETPNSKMSSEKKLQLFSDDESDEDKNKSKSATSGNKKVDLNNPKKEKMVEARKSKKAFESKNKRAEYLEKLASSDSESEEEFEGSADEEAGFVDLKDLSDEELSDDDILDDGEFVTDSDEESN